MNKLTVIDFFCGAGGFSEGFKQQGFEIIQGYDNWKPAIETFNHNFNLNSSVKNILDFKDSIDEINRLPDTSVILGSPPCVSFSNSNKSGKADKSLGLELTECYLRIVAVKKHKPKSILKAWFMENVVNSKKHLKSYYTFKDLNLTDWAKENKINPNKIAINLLENSTTINSADYGSLQARKRFIAGEIINAEKLIIPEISHQSVGKSEGLKTYNTLNILKDSLPNPFEAKSDAVIKDPQYDIKLKQSELTDHFYDSGIYQVEWKSSKYWKTNHPYMGKMSFPENLNKPSRTITATKFTNSRESIIYKTELNRSGDGEFRIPTVREAAILMGFPITYQFKGMENTKWRLVGNAVCASVSRALAKTVLDYYKVPIKANLRVVKELNLKGIINLNTYEKKEFNNPPVKKKNSRCRRHPLKDGNMTVTLSNYDIEKNSETKNKWFTSIQYGTGEGFPIQNIEDGFYKTLEAIIKKHKNGEKFLDIINNGFAKKIAPSHQLQHMYEEQRSKNNLLEPTELIEEVKDIIRRNELKDMFFVQDEILIFKNKKVVPISQLFALYAVNKITTIANIKK